ncbi:MAG: hypothetical protein QOE37_1651 [Microbacteriaceae bacterium]|nr:hypothetical protein [Microbacteriaceae bacterium]
MRWIAGTGAAWAVAMGVAQGPSAAAAVALPLLALLLAAHLVSRRAARAARATLIERTARTAATPLLPAKPLEPSVAEPDPLTWLLDSLEDEDDRRLVGLYWDFGDLADAAALLDRPVGEVQRRLIELLFDPAAPVRTSADDDVAPFDRRAIVRRWNAGETLDEIAASLGRSLFAVGGVLLGSVAQPVPQLA